MNESLIFPAAEIRSVAVIGNYLPRLCGLATFTTDLVEAICSQTSEKFCWAVAMNDKSEGYAYPDKVHFTIAQEQADEYQRAVDFININQPDVVCVQHEFGIFGGPAGSHILKLMAQLRVPVITTLHTVLLEPSAAYRNVLLRLAELSDRLIVMSHKAVDILVNNYSIDRKKIRYIPHGIPDLPFIDPNYYKEKLGVLDKKVLLTFGLLSEHKGIEYAIKALPEVIKRFADIIYIVVGATHPHVIQAKGDNYREYLQQLVANLQLENHVKFHNRFVSITELCEYLATADVYITPYNNEAQITSGTLAYAMGTGKAVISTPYWHAQELLADGRGILVPFKQPRAISEALITLLADDNIRHTLRKRAYDHSRSAVWSNVAQQYLQVFRDVIVDRQHHPRPYLAPPKSLEHSIFRQELPELKLAHLRALTDDTGLLQHAKYTIPQRIHGYCTDDNARALIVIVKSLDLISAKTEQYESMGTNYLAFLSHAFEPNTGRFRNFMDYSRNWSAEKGSEDCHGRALWALGIAGKCWGGEHRLPLLSSLFTQALPVTKRFNSPRAMAFTLLGIVAYLDVFSGDAEARCVGEILSDRLYQQFTLQGQEDWPWLENSLHYDNATLPHALIVFGAKFAQPTYMKIGLRALQWLVDVQTEAGHFVPIGNAGGYQRGGVKPRFDQQPLEAQATIDACVAAFESTNERQWLTFALNAFSWFLGDNDLHLPLYDAETGGCCDGLHSASVNQNQGAESTLAWLLSLVTLKRLALSQVLFSQRHSPSSAIGQKG